MVVGTDQVDLYNIVDENGVNFGERFCLFVVLFLYINVVRDGEGITYYFLIMIIVHIILLEGAIDCDFPIRTDCLEEAGDFRGGDCCKFKRLRHK